MPLTEQLNHGANKNRSRKQRQWPIHFVFKYLPQYSTHSHSGFQDTLLISILPFCPPLLGLLCCLLCVQLPLNIGIPQASVPKSPFIDVHTHKHTHLSPVFSISVDSISSPTCSFELETSQLTKNWECN